MRRFLNLIVKGYFNNNTLVEQFFWDLVSTADKGVPVADIV